MIPGRRSGGSQTPPRGGRRPVITPVGYIRKKPRIAEEPNMSFMMIKESCRLSLWRGTLYKARSVATKLYKWSNLRAPIQQKNLGRSPKSYIFTLFCTQRTSFFFRVIVASPPCVFACLRTAILYTNLVFFNALCPSCKKKGTFFWFACAFSGNIRTELLS